MRSGFIGRHVVRALVGRGHEVRALVRRAAAGGPPPWAGDVETVTADLETASDLDGALGGVECVVHLAAVVRGTAAEQHAATVGGTARLLAAMARSPARRLVLASSFAVYDWDAIDGAVDESSPLLGAGGVDAFGPTRRRSGSRSASRAR